MSCALEHSSVVAKWYKLSKVTLSSHKQVLKSTDYSNIIVLALVIPLPIHSFNYYQYFLPWPVSASLPINYSFP